MSFAEMQECLMRELRLYHYPIAVQYLFDEAEVEDFKKEFSPLVPAKSLSYCQWEIAARMRGDVVLGMPENLSCSSAAYCFGWKELDETILKSHLHLVRDMEQGESFFRSKVRLPMGQLKAVAVMPLGKARRTPTLAHFYCDNIQALFLCIDYMSATNAHPLRSCMSINSAACGGGVFSHIEQTFNTLPPCFGGHTSGKTERGETNVFIPGKDIEKTVLRMLERIKKPEALQGAPAPFPGAHICKNCSRIAFKQPDPDGTTKL